MTKYHVNGNGEAGKCRAQSGSCPFGGDSEHYDNVADAQAAAEQKLEQDFGAVSTVEKKEEPEQKKEHSVRIKKQKWKKFLGRDSYDGELLPDEQYQALVEAIPRDIEAGTILKRLAKTNERLAKNDGRYVYRSLEGHTGVKATPGFFKAERQFREEHGRDALYEEFPTGLISLYKCSGCSRADCDGGCLYEGATFKSEAENLRSGGEMTITNTKTQYFDRNGMDNLREHVIVDALPESTPRMADNPRKIDHAALKEQSREFAASFATYANERGLATPTENEVWIVADDEGLPDDDFFMEYQRTIKCKPEYAEVVADRFHQDAIKVNEKSTRVEPQKPAASFSDPIGRR